MLGFNKNLACAGLFVLWWFGCHPALKNNQDPPVLPRPVNKPRWCDQPTRGPYTEERFVLGAGQSNTRQQALDAAKKEIANQISARITSRYQELIRYAGTKGHSHTQRQLISQLQTVSRFKDGHLIQLKDSVTLSNGEICVLAALDRCTAHRTILQNADILALLSKLRSAHSAFRQAITRIDLPKLADLHQQLPTLFTSYRPWVERIRPLRCWRRRIPFVSFEESFQTQLHKLRSRILWLVNIRFRGKPHIDLSLDVVQMLQNVGYRTERFSLFWPHLSPNQKLAQIANAHATANNDTSSPLYLLVDGELTIDTRSVPYHDNWHVFQSRAGIDLRFYHPRTQQTYLQLRIHGADRKTAMHAQATTAEATSIQKLRPLLQGLLGMNLSAHLKLDGKLDRE